MESVWSHRRPVWNASQTRTARSTGLDVTKDSAKCSAAEMRIAFKDSTAKKECVRDVRITVSVVTQLLSVTHKKQNASFALRNLGVPSPEHVQRTSALSHALHRVNVPQVSFALDYHASLAVILMKIVEILHCHIVTQQRQLVLSAQK